MALRENPVEAILVEEVHINNKHLCLHKLHKSLKNGCHKYKKTLYCHLAVPYFARPRPILTGTGVRGPGVAVDWPASCLSIIFVLIVFCGWGNIIENIDRLTGGREDNLFFSIEENLIRSMLVLVIDLISILWNTSLKLKFLKIVRYRYNKFALLWGEAQLCLP